MPVLADTGRGPVENATLADAETNIEHFVQETIKGYVLEHVSVRRDPKQDGEGRYGFAVTILVSDQGRRDTTMYVRMPGRPLDQVRNPTAKVRGFPRLYVNGGTWAWSFAVNIARDIVRLVTGARDYDETEAEPDGLRFGYVEGLPDLDDIVAIWGGRLKISVASPTGHVTFGQLRQDCWGALEATRTLLDKRDGGIDEQWAAQARKLLETGDMSLAKDREFVLFDEQGVTVKANTHGTGGYLFVCAYVLA